MAVLRSNSINYLRSYFKQTMFMRMGTQKHILTVACCTLFGCGPEVDALKTDFVSLEFNSKEYTYQFQDSVIQFCEKDLFSPDKHRFIISKTYSSVEPAFPSFTIYLDHLAVECPETELENQAELAFILTEIDTHGKVIDYASANVTRIDQLEWSQTLYEGKIVVSGTFDGWLYKYFEERPTTEAIEPTKTDSIRARNGKFQLTLQ